MGTDEASPQASGPANRMRQILANGNGNSRIVNFFLNVLALVLGAAILGGASASIVSAVSMQGFKTEQAAMKEDISELKLEVGNLGTQLTKHRIETAGGDGS